MCGGSIAGMRSELSPLSVLRKKKNSYGVLGFLDVPYLLFEINLKLIECIVMMNSND